MKRLRFHQDRAVLFLAALILFVGGCGSSGESVGAGSSGGGGSSGGSGGGSQQPLVITTTGPLPRAVAGQAYNFSLQASGGSAPYNWTVPLGSGFLPDGMGLSASGLISGTPASDVTCSDITPTFQVQDAKGAIVSERIEFPCVIPLAFRDGAYLGDGNVGIPYSAGVNAVGGVQPYTFSLVSATPALPSGLSFVAQPMAGIIQGTAATPGNISVTIRVVDSGTPQFSAIQSFNLIIRNDLVVEPSITMPIGVQNVPYSESVQVVGGTPPYHWSSGDATQKLPAGLSMDTTTGIVHGIPVATGTFGYLVQVVDSSVPTPVAVNQVIIFNINIPLKVDTTSANDATKGRPFGLDFYLEGGRPPYSARILTGTLPDGVNLLPSSSGTNFNNFYTALSGTPTTDGLFQFTIGFTDSYETPNTVTQDYQIRISDPLVMTVPNLPPVIEGQSFSGTFQASGGFPPYSWSANSVPAGISLNGVTGIISGTAGSPGRGVVSSSESIFVTLQDSSNPPFTTSMWWGLAVFAKLRIDTSFFPTIATGSDIWLTPIYDGGVNPLKWSISSGALPPGTSLRAVDGTILGTPSIAGIYPFTLSLSDSNQPPLAQVASQAFTLVVKDRGQLNRNDTIAQATPISNSYTVGSISPFSDPGSTGPDMDIYQLTAAPGALVDLLVGPGILANDTQQTAPSQPPPISPIVPVLEVLDSSGARFQTCSRALNQGTFDSGPFTFPCVSSLDGNFYDSANYTFQVPGSGTAPVTFYVRVSDARGDARPDLIYTLVVYGAN
jgi:large repetitive protein